MMRAECMLRTSLPDHPWPMRPEAMETDRNNDSGISPGRTSSETNSNSPNFTLNSPDGRTESPSESLNQSGGDKEAEAHHYLKSSEHYSYYCGKGSSYSPPNFRAFSPAQETPKKFSMDEPELSPSSECHNLKGEKMDESSDKSNDCDYDRDVELQAEDSLERLKNALEKSSALSGIFKSRADDSDGGNEGETGKKEFPCPLCAYTTPYRHRYMEHLSTHYSDKCTLCDFTGQNIQDLRLHLQDVHNISDIQDLSDPQDNNSDYQDDDEAPNKRGKSKSFKCKQCSYVTTTKLDFWEHSKGHIKAEKLLTCPKCPFVTEYKHHLEYHLRNHFGSKPFKCTKCSYSCVNKSMLNSHLKSHSNVYQYRCADCAYATKYCHSLKLHLRKYQHKPAMVLNADGSPNPLPIIDIYGTRRGPKQKPSKTAEDVDNKSMFSDIKIPDKEKNGPNLPGGIIVPNAPQASPKSPNSFYAFNNNEVKDEPHNGLTPKFYYCTLCDFHSVSIDFLNQHMFLHAAETNLAHIFKTNNNVQDQSLVKDYFQNVLVNQSVDQVPYLDSRSVSPLSLVSPKAQFPIMKQLPSPLDLSKQESNESLCEGAREVKKMKMGDAEVKVDAPNKLTSTKHRRKGKAYKLERINDVEDSSPENFYNGKSNDEPCPIVESKESKRQEEEQKHHEEKPKENVKVEEAAEMSAKSYSCIYCDIVFKDVILYTMHMGYHGFQDPFTCNMCGHITPDKVAFFLHIARSSHS